MAATTWLVMLRDVSNTIRIKGEKHLSACMVAEMGTGDVLCVQIGKTAAEALAMAIEGAVRDPAGPRPHGLPDRILFSPTISRLVTSHVRDRGSALGLHRAELTETAPVLEAEDIFDSFIGHMSGRAQPKKEFASEGEWRMLYGLALDFLRSEVWKRWGDDVDLRLDVKVGDENSTYSVVIIGQEGIQRGLVLYPGTEMPPGLREWEPGKKVPMPDGTLMLHLDPRGQSPPEYEAKAGRYEWPAGAEFTPLFMGVSGGKGADLGYGGVVRLALGIQAAIDIDDQRIGVAGPDNGARGGMHLPDGTQATYEMRVRPPEQDEPGTVRFSVHRVAHDLVPEGSPVAMGAVPIDFLPEMRRAAKLHRPAPTPPPAGVQPAPVLVIHPRKASGDAIAAQIAHDDPIGVQLVQDGRRVVAILACVEAAHALMEMPSGAEALALYRGRMELTKGFHVVLVADEQTPKAGGTIYGMFECVTPGQPPTKIAGASRRSPKSKKRRGR